MGVTIHNESGERLYAPQKRTMADLLSQDDLNALFGLTSESPAPTAGLAAPASPTAGLSQGDLDSLLAGLADFTAAPPARPRAPAPVQDECAAPSGGTLSQDEIDRLLADFGK